MDKVSKLLWALNCNKVRRLEPSLEYFDDLIKKSLDRVKNTRIKPLKFEETLRFKNRELFGILR